MPNYVFQVALTVSEEHADGPALAEVLQADLVDAREDVEAAAVTFVEEVGTREGE